MAKPASSIAVDLINRLQKSGKQIITIPWPDMYKICERDRFKDSFLEALKQEVNKRFFVIEFENNIVIVCQDTDFSPLKGDI